MPSRPSCSMIPWVPFLRSSGPHAPMIAGFVQQHRPGFDAAGCGLTESERTDVALLERLLLPSLFEEAGFAYMRDVVAAVNGYRHVCRVL